MKRTATILFTLVIVFMFAGSAFAIDPRDAVPAPAGTKVMTLYYQYISGHKNYRDGKKVPPLTGTGANEYDVNSTLWTLRPTYYGKVGAFPWAVTAFFTWGDREADVSTPAGSPAAHLKAQGMADLRAAAAFWFYSNAATKHHAVYALYVTAPTGDYQNNRPLNFNMGANWWSFQHELAWVKAFGPLYVQLVGGVFQYTKNEDYESDSKTQEKEPLWYGEAHFSYDITPKFWAAVSGLYQNGGRTKINGVDKVATDYVQDWTLYLSVQYRLTPETSLQLCSKPKIHTENGSDAAANIYVKFNYFF